MGGLNVFHFLSIPTPPKLQIPKPSFLQKQLSNPKTHFSPTTLNNPKSRKLNLNVSTEPITTPFAPEVETQGEGEKFDWFAHWYPVAPVSDLDKKVPHGKRVMGIDIVVWWDRNIGEWQVFEDKCPHRLAPLSEGRIDQWGRLQCVYHGWCFNGAGDCKFIPQAPVDGPQIQTSKKACASVYPCFEQNRILWFWPSNDPRYKDIATRERPTYIPEMDDPAYTKSMMQRDVPYGYEILIENLMDPAHVPYAHYGILSVPSSKARDKADREGGKPIEINVQKIDINGFSAKQDNGNNKFVPPCVFYYSPDKLVSAKQESSSKMQQKSLLMIFFCIPVSPGKSRIIFSFPRNFAVWVDHVVPRWMSHINSNLIIDSDLYLLHLEELKIADIGPFNWQKACFVPTKSDAIVVAFRNWIRKYAGGQIDWGSKFGRSLPLTPPKEVLMDRYWSHVVNCSSCRVAVKRLKVLEAALQVFSIVSIGVIATIKQGFTSSAAKNTVIVLAVLCFAGSRWLSHFIYKTFYFHDYNHALK